MKLRKQLCIRVIVCIAWCMLLRSSKTYSTDHLNIESKLDLILRELQDLKLKVEGLENKNTQENSIDETEVGEGKTPIGVE